MSPYLKGSDMGVFAVLHDDRDLSDHEEDVCHEEHHEEGVELHQGFLDDLVRLGTLHHVTECHKKYI